MITPEQTRTRNDRPGGIAHLLLRTAPGVLFALAVLFLSVPSGWVCSAAEPDPAAKPAPLVVRLIPKGDTWQYLDDGSDQGEAWRAPKFDASAWRAAPAELGYGDHNEATAIQYGPDAKHKYVTSYFRRSFNVPDPAKFKGLRAGLLCDDGAVVYLNGKEVVRRNMPKGPIAAATLAAKQIGGNEETRYSGHDLSAALLTPGANVVAVEVHQGNPASSDLSFDFELVAADEKDVALALLAMHRRNVSEDRDFVRANLPKPEGAAAGTWPAFMRDRKRSGVSPATLSLPLQPVWTHLPDHPPSPAWYAPATRPREGFTLLNRMAFDDACQVTISEGSVFFGSSATDCIVSLDVKTGKRNWLFPTGGPVRLAPAIWQGKLYAGSDDGFVYCLTAKDGKLVWKHRAGPRDERLLGNGRMISRWPVRTDVLVHEGIAYFGAGVFPHEGTLLQALDAENGNVIWRNDTLGQTNANRDPVTPQGYLLASDDLLFVPSGRAMPAAFAKSDGSFVYQKSYSWRGTQGCGPTGGVYALLAKGQLYTGTSQLLALDQRRGGTGFGWFKGRRMVVSGDMAFMANGTEIVSMRLDPYAQMTRRTPEFQTTIRDGEYRYAVSRQERSRKRRAVAEAERQMARIDLEIATAQKQGAKGAEAAKALALRRSGFEKAAEDAQQRVDELDPVVADTKAKLDGVKREKQRHRTRSEKATLLWRQSSACVDAMVLVGNALIAGGKDKIMAMDPVSGDVLWSCDVQGTVRGLAVVPGYLLASTTKGHIYCFGTADAGAPRADVSVVPATRKLGPSDPATSSQAQIAERVLKLTGRRRGWALVLGTDGGRLARELAVRSELNLVVVEPDSARAAAAEQYLRAERLYGARAVVHTLSPATDLPYPNYFADLVVAAGRSTAAMFPQGAGHLARHVKPHGGTVCFATAPGQGITAEKLRAQVQQLVPGEPTVTQADGRSWCVATRGALPGAGNWTHQYANPGNTGASEDTRVKGALGVLWYGAPGPAPMVDRHAAAIAPLALDGRMFVQGENVVMAYDAYNGTQLWKRPIRGAIRAGMKGGAVSNFAVDRTGVFVGARNTCMVLAVDTGQTLAQFEAPAPAKGWGYVAVADGILFGSDKTRRGEATTAFAFDIKTKKLLWTYQGETLITPTFAVGDGRLYFVDSSISNEEREQALAGSRRGLAALSGKQKEEAEAALKRADVRRAVCLEARTGKVLWRRGVDVTECSGTQYGAGTLTSILADDLFLLCGASANGHFWKQFLAGTFDRRRIAALHVKDGAVAWARDIPYRTRPLVIGQRVIADPYAVDLQTGSFIERTHPITGRKDRWQFLRGGHHCGAVSGSPNMLFFRAGSTAYYDLSSDSGVRHFAGHRPGCWINAIPAAGLALIPEASAGCICNYSIRCTVVLEPRAERDPAWAVCAAKGPTMPVRRRLAVNLGAPGDHRDKDGTLWLAHPRPTPAWYTRTLELALAIQPSGKVETDYTFAKDSSVAAGFGQKGWLFGSGYCGDAPLVIPLAEAAKATPSEWTVRVHLAPWPGARRAPASVDVKVQGQTVAKGIRIPPWTSAGKNGLVREFTGISAKDKMTLQIVPSDKAATSLPILGGVELIPN